jgi:4-hydroxybutyryl-CoA dehydratase / vinylacetyl-CoA-Delta-isomerase
MMTGDEYRATLRDGRRIFYDGKPVGDVTEDPKFRTAVDIVARGYDAGVADPGETDALYRFPRTVPELRERIGRLASWEVTRATTLESLLALQTAGDRMGAGTFRERIDAYVAYCRDHDLRCVQTITDAKGDRSRSAKDQIDPDLYLRVVERRPDGIVINGAKLHISAASIAHELVVIPTKRMRRDEGDWAVACAVPVATEGVVILNTNPAPEPADAEYHPYSRSHAMPEGMVVFDHVFVPYDRVFLDGETQHSAVFAHSLGLWQRLGAVARLAQEADMLVGLAQLLAEANGLERIHHIRDKISDLVIYASLIRAGMEAAIANAHTSADGYVTPDEVYTNAAKYYGAANLAVMMRNIHDIGGGAVLTAPLPGDLAHPVTRPYVEKYMRTRESIGGEYRTRLMHAVRDLTADTYGGWWQVSSLMSGGGLYAQKLVATKNYDMARARSIALDAIGLTDPGSPS